MNGECTIHDSKYEMVNNLLTNSWRVDAWFHLVNFSYMTV